MVLSQQMFEEMVDEIGTEEQSAGQILPLSGLTEEHQDMVRDTDLCWVRYPMYWALMSFGPLIQA